MKLNENIIHGYYRLANYVNSGSVNCSEMSDSLQLMDCSLLGSSIHEILQARILEWIAIPFSRGSSCLREQTQISCIAGRFFTI